MNTNYIIILLNYNNWVDTKECIESLLVDGIDYKSILIIDNGSSDDSPGNLKSIFPEIQLISNSTNLGFSGGNNVGLKYSLEKGFEYAILLNNDTLVESGAIKKLIIQMDNHQEVSLGTGQIRSFPDKNKIWYAGGKMIPLRGLAVHIGFGEDIKNISLPDFSYTDFISGCYICIRLSDIEKLGLLEEKFFLYLEDIEYSARAAKKGLKMLYVHQSVIYHKWRGETKLKYQTLYYAVRNRLLLIDLAFPKTAKIYFLVVISMKLFIWYLTNRLLFNAAVKGLHDYRRGYFGVIES